jgi:hypothetical protein
MTGYAGEDLSSEEARSVFLGDLIDVAVWLSDIMVSQGELDFPRLPAKPGLVARPKATPEEQRRGD